LYYSLESNKTSNHKINSSADDVIKISAKHTPIMTSSTKNPKPKTKNNLILYYKTSRVFQGFEQHSSSICCWVMAGQSLAWDGKSYLCV